METLESRVRRLERETRRWRIGASVAGFAAVIAVVGAARPADGVAEQVRTRRLFLHDEADRLRAEVFMDEGGPSLRLFEVGANRSHVVPGGRVREWIDTHGYIQTRSWDPRVMLMESVTTTVVSLEDGGKRVILGGGSRSKVEVGYTFDIYRVNQYIGRVKIDRVETDRCFGDVEFVAPGRAVQAGDSAATRL